MSVATLMAPLAACRLQGQTWPSLLAHPCPSPWPVCCCSPAAPHWGRVALLFWFLAAAATLGCSSRCTATLPSPSPHLAHLHPAGGDRAARHPALPADRAVARQHRHCIWGWFAASVLIATTLPTGCSHPCPEPDDPRPTPPC